MNSDKHMRKGVGVVLVNDNKRIFAGARAAMNGKMISWFLKKPWQMPQGGIEEGETPEDALRRELLEEIGSNDIEIISETNDWVEYTIPQNLRRRNTSITGQQQKWFLAKFNGDDYDIDLKSSNHPEFDTWQWTSRQNLVRLSVHFKRKLYIQVFKEFNWYFEKNQLI